MAADFSDALHLSGKQLAEVPQDVLSNCDSIAILDLSRNKGIRLHGTLSKFKNVRKLVLEGCALHALPDDMVELTKLEELDLSFNWFFYGLDAIIGHLRGLKKLVLSACDLQLVPDWLAELETLEELDLSFNPFYDGLNATMGRLRRLKKLVLTACNLQTVPEWLVELEMVKSFGLHHEGNECNDVSC